MKKENNNTVRLIACVATALVLITILVICSRTHQIKGVRFYSFLASIAILAPLLTNLSLRSRFIAFLSGPIFVVFATVTSTTEPESIHWLPVIVPSLIFYTAPFWILSWMITDRLKKKIPEESCKKNDKQLSSEIFRKKKKYAGARLVYGLSALLLSLLTVGVFITPTRDIHIKNTMEFIQYYALNTLISLPLLGLTFFCWKRYLYWTNKAIQRKLKPNK